MESDLSVLEVPVSDAPDRSALSAPRLLRSLGFSWQGICHITTTQPNWRIELAAAGFALVAGIVLHLGPGELALLALTIGFVLSAEAANTAVEATVDAIGVRSLAAKHAKDAASAAVLVAALTAIVVGLFLFVPRLWILLGAPIH